MSDEGRIKSWIKEAEVYRTQGLYEESRNKYLEILQFIQKSPKLSGHVKLIERVQNRIQMLDKDVAVSDEEGPGPVLPQDQQALIKRLFTFSKKEETGAIEGAVALAKFGQYEQALGDFRRLLKEKTQPVLAAKNVIRCHLALLSPDAAIDEFRQWLSSDLLSKMELKNIRVFLKNVLEQQGIESEVPEVIETPSETPQPEERQEEIVDICSVRLRLEDSSGKGRMLEFDVTFQSGNVISFIVSAKEQDVVEALNVGGRLPDMEFYSPIAIFRGSGVVSGKTKIRSGPKKGAYMLDISLEP